MTLRLNGSTSGYSEIDAPAIAGDQLFTLPETGGTLDRINRAGNILQVVSTTKTDQFTTASTSFTDVTGLSVSITPSSSSSKILVFANVCYGNTSSGENTILQLVRGGTAIGNGASGFIGGRQDTNAVPKAGIGYLDAPSSTSSLTYKVQIKAANGTSIVNRRGSDTAFTFSSDITVIEVAA